MRYWVGLDVGQAADYTAIAILERKLKPVGKAYPATSFRNRDLYSGSEKISVIRQDVECHYHVRHLERPPLRTPYTRVADGVLDRLRKLEPMGLFGDTNQNTVGLIIDATGVGRGVADMIYNKIQTGLSPTDPRVSLVAATITAGFKSHYEHGFWHIPKKELIFNGGVIPLQDGRMKWGRGIASRDVLEKELANYRPKVNISGHMTFEPWRDGEHDDLLFALCLAGWAFEKTKIKHQDTRVKEGPRPEGFSPFTHMPMPPRLVEPA